MSAVRQWRYEVTEINGLAVPISMTTESIYRRYAIVDEAMQREAAARLDAWMAAPPAHHRRPP